MEKVNIENTNGALERDIYSKAVLNNDAAALNAYRAERRRQAQLNNMMNEFEQIKNEVSEIKSLLKELISKR